MTKQNSNTRIQKSFWKVTGLSCFSSQVLKDSQMDRPSLKPQQTSHWHFFFFFFCNWNPFPQYKIVNYPIEKWKHVLCQRQEILRRNRLDICQMFLIFFSHFPFLDTQTHMHTHILIYIIYADIDGILRVERGGRCLEGSISQAPDLCYYRWNVAFSLETVKRVLRPQKKRCLQNYLPPHICS